MRVPPAWVRVPGWAVLPVCSEAVDYTHGESRTCLQVVLRNALAPRVVAELNAAVASSRQAQPDDWALRGPGSGNGWRPIDAKDGGSAVPPGDGTLSGRALEISVGEAGRFQSESGTLLRHDATFDAAALCEPVVRLATMLMEGRLMLTHMEAMWRAPVPELPPSGGHAHHQMWHREGGGSYSLGLPACMPTLQCIFYLSDCTAETHCFSVVPESTAAKELLTVRENGKTGRTVVSDYHEEEFWYTHERSDGFDVHAPAGSVVMQNNLNIHAATVRGGGKRTPVINFHCLSSCFHCRSALLIT